MDGNRTACSTPMRKCVGCNQMKPKRELVRIVKNKADQLFLDASGKSAGRGAYVCRQMTCVRTARKGRGLERAFSCRIAAEFYDEMERKLEHHE